MSYHAIVYASKYTRLIEYIKFKRVFGLVDCNPNCLKHAAERERMFWKKSNVRIITWFTLSKVSKRKENCCSEIIRSHHIWKKEFNYN